MVCQRHFQEWCFMNTEKKNKLVWNAVPTLFDIPYPAKQTVPRAPPKLRSDPPPSKRRRTQTGNYIYANISSGTQPIAYVKKL